MKCFRILILFFIQAYFNTLNAQSVKDFNIINFTNGNGLPQNSIKSLELDKDGYMWMGTESGLVRFDGKNFRIYNRNNLPGLTSDRISHVGLMTDNSIFFIDEHSVIYRRNSNRSFSPSGQRANDDLVQSTAGGFYNPGANLGIAGYNYIRSRYIDQWTNSIVFFPTTDSLTGFISVNKRSLAYVDHQRVLWIKCITSCNRHVLRSSGMLDGKFYFLDDAYKVQSMDRDGHLSTTSIEGLPANPLNEKAPPADFALLQQQNELYLLFRRKIYQLHTTGSSHTLTATLVLDAENMENISCFRHYPRLHLYAIGTNTQGLFLIMPKPFSSQRAEGTDNIFYAQVPYGDSAVLSHYGLFSDHGFTSLPGGRYYKLSILKDRRGGYWLSKPSESIVWLDNNFRTRREIKMTDLYVNCFAQSPDNTVWFVTNKNRIGRIQEQGISWIDLHMSANSLVTLLPDGNEHLWVAGSRQLFRLNTRTGKILHYDFFKDHDVRSLYLDRSNVLWIGTYGKGFFALSGKRLVRLPSDSKGNLSYVHGLLEDRSGNVWITTNNGLFRTRKNDLESYIRNRKDPVFFQHYTKEEGFNTNEFNGGCSPSGVELPSGKISLPSMNGLVQFFPDSLKDNFPSADIFIDELWVNGKNISLREQPELPPSFNRLDIMVSSPYYGNPDNQQLEYCLQGFDDDKWYPVAGNNTITYNRLPYGVYTLRLRKKAGFDVRNYITGQLTFRVVPFFYQQWYFKLFALLLCSGIILLFFRIRYFYLISRQHKLEHKVQQRTRELVYNNRLKEKLTLLVAHDLQSPLHFLSILARHVYKAAQNNDHKSVMEGSEEIRNTTAKIYAFVEEFNLWNKSMSESFRLKKDTFPIRPLMEELQQFFEEMLRLKKNRLEIIYSSEADIVTDRDVLKAVLRNIIDNANKYTHGGLIRVETGLDEQGCMMMTVIDTGEGMQAEELEKIRQRILQAPSVPAIEKDGRLGFQLIIDFAARLEAKLMVSSVRQQGTTVTLSGFACARQD